MKHLRKYKIPTLTREQALAAVCYSTRSQATHAAATSLAFPQYIVRDINNAYFTDTPDIAFALAARMQCAGTIINRYDWKSA